MIHQPKSGLRDLKRDFTSSNADTFVSRPPGSSQTSATLTDIRNTFTQNSCPSSSIQTTTAGKAARLNAIAQALKEQQANQPLPKKRPSSENHSQPAKKAKSVPWEDDDEITLLSAPAPAPVKQKAASSKRPAKIFLSAEQKKILTLVQQGNSVFYTGSAGTGKSVLLREIIKALRFKHARSPDAVAITASTGIAACNIGGMTIHSFSGIGLGLNSAEQLATKVKKNMKANTRWQRTKVLIIDEISMVDGDLFDKLARMACILRKNTRPFGGIQLIVTGDFFQLPPVSKGESKFAFEADTWHECIGRTFNLTQVFRQKDEDFITMLNEMRFGRLTSKSIKKFKALEREIHYDDGIEPTELFPRRENVEASNNARNRTLRGESHSYQSTDSGKLEGDQREKLLQNSMYPPILELKIGSQVMLIKNTDDTLVNGSIGKVKAFMSKEQWEHAVGSGGVGNAYEEDGKDKVSRMPKKTTTPFPVVTFSNGNELGGERDILVIPETWKSETPQGEVQVQRIQLPLILSWAMSIHKSQGQTLDRVKIDLRRVFEKGQAYVALSRATSLEGLQVLGFHEDKVMAHPKVIEWCKTLETIGE